MFSKRAAYFQGIPNRLYRERDQRIRDGKPVIDLFSGNVNRHGIQYPSSLLKEAFRAATAFAKTYQPNPLGQPIARLAIQKYYQEEGVSIPAEQIVLTPGTSLSYLYLFKLLANPGDEILCPTPTYPLFDAIANLCDVKMVSYRLVPTGERWPIDFDHLKTKINAKTRAIVLISPHNPTGAVANEAEIAMLSEIARTHGVPIISDEVFSPFLFTRNRLPRPATITTPPLVFTLNGISKMLALAGVKIGWIGISGEKQWVAKSLRMLQGISDTFLPVNELAQFALPALLHKGKPFMQRYRSQMAHRREIAISLLSQSADLSLTPPEGGFYMTIQMRDPRRNDEKVALELLREEGLLVHPGYFYDLPPGHFVMSFVAKPTQLKKSLEKIVQHFK